MDEIRIHDLQTECIVGIHAHERTTPQTLVVNVTLYLDTRQAAATGRIGRTVHYAEVAEQVMTLLRFRRYRLLEVAATEIACMLLGLHERLARVRIEVQKPAALSGLAKAASLTIERDRSLLPSGSDGARAGSRAAVVDPGVVPLWQSREASLTLVTVPPRGTLPLCCPDAQGHVDATVGASAAELAEGRKSGATTDSRYDTALRHLVWIASGELEASERRLYAGQTAEHDDGAVLWVNRAVDAARVFCCSTWCEPA